MIKDDKRQVTVFFSPAELRMLRMAAANKNLSASAFLKQCGLVAAVDEMKGFSPKDLLTDVPTVPARRRGQRAGQKERL